MGGGLLNLVAYGNLNVILHGNPSKTFFKTSYAKHTNFGLQKFRLDYKGLKTLKIGETSTFTFKVERYADLLLDTYLVVNLPHIWSPLYPVKNTQNNPNIPNTPYYIPYEFRWIKHLGTKIYSDSVVTKMRESEIFSSTYLKKKRKNESFLFFSAEKNFPDSEQ